MARRLSRRARCAGGAALLACAGAPALAGAEPAATIEARGNTLLGGLAFAPAQLEAAIGDELSWRAADALSPHGAREEHGLWDAGTASPGAVVGRVFEAGTHRYVCTVHGERMRGTVAVPVELEAERRRLRRTRTRRRARTVAQITVRWTADPASGQAFDVQRRRPGGDWSTFVRGSTYATSHFRTRPGTRWEVRARLRADGGTPATGWSPPAAITG